MRKSLALTLLLFFVTLASPLLSASDWPTYLHDDARSGTTAEELSLPLSEAWAFKSEHPPSPAWPPPAEQDFWNKKADLPARVVFDRAFHVVSDGFFVYFGSSSDDQVRSLNLQTGELNWTFFTEGPVRLAPTLDSGKLYVGSDDGSVYCLASATGELIWQYRRGEDRRIPGNGRIISVWPVRSGIIVRNEQVRFASGLFPLHGTYQHLLDARDGRQLAEGPLSFSPQGYLRLQRNRIVIPQGRAEPTQLVEIDAKSSGADVKEDGVTGDFTDYPNAMVRSGAIRFAGGDGRVAAFGGDGTLVWSSPVNGVAYSLAVAGGSLLVSTDRGIIHCFRSSVNPPRQVETAQPQSAPRRSEWLQDWALNCWKESGIDRGYALVLGDQVGPISAQLAGQSQLKLVGSLTDSLELDRQRRWLSRRGLYGRVVLHSGSEKQLPYGSALFNLVVLNVEAEESPQLAPLDVARLLVPGEGLAIVGPAFSATGTRGKLLDKWVEPLQDDDEFVVSRIGEHGFQIERSELSGVGRWTHMYAAPNNRACSEDRLVDSRLRLQWFGQPGPRQMLDRHHRTVPPLFVAGKLFVPGNDRVFAVDAYNGSPLWDTEVAEYRRVGAMRDSGNMAAAVDYLYIVARDRCYGLDCNTGSYELNFTVPKTPGQGPREWGYVAYVEDQLFGSVTRPGASRNRHSRDQIDETYFDSVPIVTSESLFGLERHSGALQWQYRAQRGAIVNPTITIADGRMYFVESHDAATLMESTGRSKLASLVGGGADLVALDTAGGNIVWRKRVDLRDVRHHLYLCHAGGKLIASGSKNKEQDGTASVWYDLHAFDAENGRVLWSATQNQRVCVNGDHGEQDHHPVIVGEVVYQEPYAYELDSGRRLEDWEFQRGGHGCGTVSASASTFFFRAENPSLRELGSTENQKVTAVSRPGCWINMIPAGGLLLIPEASSGCTCDFPIQSSIALVSESVR